MNVLGFVFFVVLAVINDSLMKSARLFGKESRKNNNLGLNQDQRVFSSLGVISVLKWS
jgi:hypothetical protein